MEVMQEDQKRYAPAGIHSARNTAALQRLALGCRQSAEFYRQAAFRISDPRLKMLFQTYARQRDRFARELYSFCAPEEIEQPSQLQPMGHSPQNESLSTEEAIKQCQDWEALFLNLYRDALQSGIPIISQFLVRAQLALLQKSHSRVCSLQNELEPRSDL